MKRGTAEAASPCAAPIFDTPLLLLALLSAVSCAGPSTTPGLLAGPAAAQTIREEFNPRSLGEDLLLIQATFARQSLQASAIEPTPPPEDAAVSDLPVDIAAEDFPVEYGPVDVFRLQLVTLSKEATALKLQAELEQVLGVEVHLVTRGQHYLLQAGQYETHSQAARLKERVDALGPDYADAYVVSATIKAPLIAPDPVEDAPAAAPVEMVRIFGWRVLIDQFLSHDEADRLKRRAQKRLRREDIDVTFKAPWYKIEVGHYRTEPQAQIAAEKIDPYYPNALKVRSQILVPREN